MKEDSEAGSWNSGPKQEQDIIESELGLAKKVAQKGLHEQMDSEMAGEMSHEPDVVAGSQYQRKYELKKVNRDVNYNRLKRFLDDPPEIGILDRERTERQNSVIPDADTVEGVNDFDFEGQVAYQQVNEPPNIESDLEESKSEKKPPKAKPQLQVQSVDDGEPGSAELQPYDSQKGPSEADEQQKTEALDDKTFDAESIFKHPSVINENEKYMLGMLKNADFLAEKMKMKSIEVDRPPRNLHDLPVLSYPGRSKLDELEGKKTADTQTTPGYDLIPQVIWFNVQSKMYDMCNDLTREFKQRQQTCDASVRENSMLMARLRERVSDVEFRHKRDKNMLDEFARLDGAQMGMKDDINTLRGTFEEVASMQTEKINQFKQQILVQKNDVTSEIGRMKANEMSEAKVNRLFEHYSKNMLEKFQQTAASFTDEICRLENRYRTISEMINHNNVRVANNADFVQKADIRFAKLETESARCSKAVDAMEPVVMDFDKRVANVERQLDGLQKKQDIEMRNLNHQINDAITQDDAYRMVYNFNGDLIQHLFDPAKHTHKPSYDNPKLDTAITTLSNYYEWQIQTSAFNYRDLMGHYLDRSKDHMGVQLKDKRPIRGKHFRLIANAEKTGRKVTRRHSVEGAKGTMAALHNLARPSTARDSDGDPITDVQSVDSDCPQTKSLVTVKDYAEHYKVQREFKLTFHKKEKENKRRNSHCVFEREKRTVDNLWTFDHERQQTNLMSKFANLGLGGSMLGQPGARPGHRDTDRALDSGRNRSLRKRDDAGGSSLSVASRRQKERPVRPRDRPERPDKGKARQASKRDLTEKPVHTSPRGEDKPPAKKTKKTKPGTEKSRKQSKDSSDVSEVRIKDRNMDPVGDMKKGRNRLELPKVAKGKHASDLSVGSADSQQSVEPTKSKEKRKKTKDKDDKLGKGLLNRVQNESSRQRDRDESRRKSPEDVAARRSSQVTEGSRDSKKIKKRKEGKKKEEPQTSAFAAELVDSSDSEIELQPIQETAPQKEASRAVSPATKREEAKAKPQTVEDPAQRQQSLENTEGQSEAAPSVRSSRKVRFQDGQMPSSAVTSDGFEDPVLDSPSSTHGTHVDSSPRDDSEDEPVAKQKTQTVKEAPVKQKATAPQPEEDWLDKPKNVAKALQQSEGSVAEDGEDDQEEDYGSEGQSRSASHAFTSEESEESYKPPKKKRGEPKRPQKEKAPKKLRKKESSSDDDSSSSDDGSKSGSSSVDSADLKNTIRKVCSSMLKQYPSKDDLYDELDYVREDIRKEMIEDLRPLFEDMAHEMIQASVGESTAALASLITETAEQLTAATDSKLEEAGRSCTRYFEKVKGTVIPAAMAQVDRRIEDSERASKVLILETEARLLEAMKQYKDDLEIFDAKLDGTLIKFHKLSHLVEAFKAEVKTLQDKMVLKLDVLHNELQALANMTSTLVELEFVQQSLDFQDEVDKTKLHLFGLSDTQLSLDEMASMTGVAGSTATGGGDHHHLRRDVTSNTQKFNPIERALRRKVMQEASKHGGGAMNSSSLNFRARAGEYDDSMIQEHPIAVQLSDECLGCGDPRMKKKINAAFKMACVQYKPSWVLYRGHKFQRKKLIEAKRQILDAEWSIMLRYEPFKALFGEVPHVTFSAHLVEKLYTFSGTSRDKLMAHRMGKQPSAGTVSTVGDGGSSFLDTTNMLQSNVARLENEANKHLLRQSTKQGQETPLPQFNINTENTIQPPPPSTVLESQNSINVNAEIPPQASTIPEKEPVPPTSSPQDSMLLLIDKLDGGGSTIVDAQDFESRVSPRAIASQPQIQRKQDTSKSPIELNETNYSRKAIRATGVASGIGTQRYKANRGKESKHNESVFSSGPNEDLLQSLQKPATQYDDFAIPIHNLSVITANEPIQQAFNDSRAFVDQSMHMIDINPGFASQSIMHRDNRIGASPLNNANLASTRHDTSGRVQSKPKMNDSRVGFLLSSQRESSRAPKVTDESLMLSMRQLVGKNDESPESTTRGQFTTMALRGIIGTSRERVTDLNKSTRNQRQQLIEAARMRKGKGTGGGGTWNHKKPDRTSYGKNKTGQTKTDFFIGGGSNPTALGTQRQSTDRAMHMTQVVSQGTDTPNVRRDSGPADNMIVHSSLTKDQINDISNMTGLLSNVIIQRADPLQTKSLQLPQLNPVKVDQGPQKNSKVARKNLKAQVLHSRESQSRISPTANPRESITVNALVGVRRGAPSHAASNREDVQTAHAGSSKMCRENNNSPCTCHPPEYFENDQSGEGEPYIPTAAEMLRELEAVGNSALGAYPSSNKAFERESRKTQQNPPIRLKSPSSESALSNAYFDPGFPPIQHVGDAFGPIVVSSQQRQLERAVAPQSNTGMGFKKPNEFQ